MHQPAFLTAQPVSFRRSFSHGAPRAHREPRPPAASSLHAPRMSCARPTLLARLHARAAADAALVRAAAAQASQAALTAAAVATVALGTLAPPAALADIPTAAPAALLLDDAGVVQKGSAQQFMQAAGKIRERQHVTVRFVMARSVPYGETVDEYARELADEWGLGETDVLFVASPKLARAGVWVGADVRALPPEVAESLANETYAVPAGEERYGTAVLEVSNRLIPVLAGEADPGPPDLKGRAVTQTYKTKEETSSDRNKYVTVVVVILVISVVAPLIQTYWYVRDD